jgi:outer membrane receptor protein involved in Fe transport
LNQNTVRGTGSGTKRTQAYSAIVAAKLGAIELTALSGYSINKISDSIDFSPLFGGVGGPADQLFPGILGAPNFETLKTTKFSQEVRLSAPIGQRLDWLFGAFYTHESTPWTETTFAADPAAGVLIAPIFTDSIQTTYEEYAAFTDLTIHLTDLFDVQVGGRESRNRQTYMEQLSGSSIHIFFGQPSPLINPQEVTQDSSFTYLVTPELKLSSHFMLYGRLASGYRNGGPNTTAVLFNLPPHFEPDTTRNYEIGTKGDLFDNTLSFDASVYYIDWQNIQIQTNTPQGATYVGNASRAKSQGVELSTNWRPSTGLKIAAWVAWNDAVLTESFPNASPIYGVSGDRLPYSARFSGNLSIQQDFPLWGSASGFVGGAISYVGDRESVFTPKLAPQRQDLPAYTKTDLRAGVKNGSWTTNLYVDNVTDQRGVLSGGLGAFLNYTPMAFTYIQPRTIGVSIAKSF